MKHSWIMCLQRACLICFVCKCNTQSAISMRVLALAKQLQPRQWKADKMWLLP